jgi:hypothetical protein
MINKLIKLKAMKNKLLRFLLLNLFVVATLGVFAQLPVSHDFNTTQNNWVISTVDFEYGVTSLNAPVPAYDKGPADKFFMTGLDAAYSNNVMTSVVSETFNFLTAVTPQVSIDIYADCDFIVFGGDGGFLEYSLDGSTWVAIDGTPTWYDGTVSPISANYAGSACWATQSWTTFTAIVPAIAGESTVSFRVVFVSDPTSNSGAGIGFDNFGVIETAPPVDDMTIAYDSPVSQICAMSATESITVTVTNTGQTTISTFNLDYIVDAGAPVPEVVTPAVALAPNDFYTYTSTATFDLSAAGHTVAVNVWTVGGAADGLVEIITNQNLPVMNTFPHLETWGAGYFWFINGSDAINTAVATEVSMSGNLGTSWNGGSLTTTSTQAWDENTDNQVLLYGCMVDATALPTAELLIDLYRQFSYGEKYSWFRVLVNGVAIADTDGNSEFNALSATGDWTAHRFNLDSYAGTTFTLELQAANRYATDIVRVDNLIFRQKLANDVSLNAIVAPASGCSLDNLAVTVEIANLGTMPQSGFNVQYVLNGGIPVVETFALTIPAGYAMNYTFTALIGAIDILANNTIVCSTTLGTDQDATNDTMTGMFDEIGNDLTSAYSVDFSTDVLLDNWAVEDQNIDNSTWEWLPGVDSYYGFDFEGASGMDWLFTRCFDLTGGDSYQICYNYASYLSTAMKNLDIYLVDAQSSSATMMSIVSHSNFNTADQIIFNSAEFVAPANGAYYVAFKVSGLATFEAEYVLLADFTVKTFEAPTVTIAPIAITDGTNPLTDACSITAPVTIDIDFTQPTGSMLCPGDALTFDLYMNAAWSATQTYTLSAFDITTGTANMLFTGVDISTPGEYSFYVEAYYDGALVGTSANADIVHIGYPTGVSFTGLDAGYCLNVNNIALTGAYDVESWIASYTFGYTANSGLIHDVVGADAQYDASVVANDMVYFTVTADGCATSFSANTVVTNPTIGFASSLIYESYPVSATLDPLPSGAYTYLWSTSETTATIVAGDYGTYTVTATEGYCSVDDMITVSASQDIDLRMGWGIFSSYIDNPGDIATVMAGVAANIIIVKDKDGSVWFPPALNGIGSMIVGDGYQYKASAADVLTIDGTPVVPETTVISTPQNYTILGYLKYAPAAAATEFAGITSLIIAKDQDGMVYWPGFGINTLPSGNLTPGQGYKVKSLVSGSFSYTANAMTNKANIYTEMPQYFVAESTGANMTIGVPANTHSLNIGDEVGVFNSNGTLVGSAVYSGSNMAIAVYGDDELTNELEGMAINEHFTFKVWNSMNNAELDCQFEMEAGKDYYQNDAIVIVKNLETSGTNNASISLLQNMPNPFATETTIGYVLPEDAHVSITVYNVVGELIEEIVSSEKPAGNHEVVFNAANCASGTYFYKIIAGDFVETKYMTIEK